MDKDTFPELPGLTEDDGIDGLCVDEVDALRAGGGGVVGRGGPSPASGSL